MKKTLYRFFALLMTASFLFAMASPAFATSVTEDTFLAYAMPADIVASSLINGIGVLPGDDVQVYEGVVQRCVNYLTDLGRVVDGKIDVWKREQVGDNAWKYGADISLVEVIRSWLFDSDVVVDAFSGIQDFQVAVVKKAISYYDTNIAPNPYCILKEIGNGNLSLGCSRYPIVLESGSTYCSYYDGVKQAIAIYTIHTDYYTYSGASTTFNTSGTPVKLFRADSSVSASSELATGFIAPGSVVFGDAYPDWYRNIATIPLPGAISPDDDIKALPFAPGQTLGDTLTIPQEDVWTGTGSYVEAPAVPDAATLSDVLTAVLSIPANIVEGIGNLFFPAVDGLTMSLSDFFPFCIPYDLFEFFTLLQAEPEAPKFEWKIPVPQLGRTFEVEVDLSAWDEVAQLFRNLELLAFIVGLAYVTREKFLRS